MDINAYLRKEHERLRQQQPGRDVYPLARRIRCADGFSLSVQANSGAYCTPRENGMYPYTEVEIGYPSAPDPIIAPYAEDPGELTGTVYPYVPVTLVEILIAAHGGQADTAEAISPSRKRT